MKIIKNYSEKELVKIGFLKVNKKECFYEKKIDDQKDICIGYDNTLFLKIYFREEKESPFFYRTYYDSLKIKKYCKDLFDINLVEGTYKKSTKQLSFDFKGGVYNETW